MNQPPVEFWSLPAEDLLKMLGSTKEGLSSAEAKRRIALLGTNQLRPAKSSSALSLLISQFKSPIILILLFATILSFFLHDRVDAFIILSIVIVSGLLGFWQEYSASNAIKKLLSIVQTKAAVMRNGTLVDIYVEEVVPGDIVKLNAGDIIPGDSLVLDSNDLFVDEAILTGETFPVEKAPVVLPRDTQLSQRTNSLWMGTHVVNGIASVLIVHTGKDTELGKVSERLKLRPLETEFELGIRRFGYFLMEVTLLLVVSIFAINVYLVRPVLDSFLFSLALAVGLTPQLLPAIISINLSHGAKRMAEKKVIVKRLSSIENFGSMNVICSDKTGTLTEGVVQLKSALDIDGSESEKVLLNAYINAFYETGFQNPIDEAIRSYRRHDLSGYNKLKEIPYDFIRKRLSILVSHDNKSLMVTKGALQNILDICRKVEASDGTISDISTMLGLIQKKFEEFSNNGFRTLGVAYRNIPPDSQFGKDEETEMTFSGFLILFDPPKPNVINTIINLKKLGVALKVITGDNHLVAANVSRQVGLNNAKILTGSELGRLSDASLIRKVGEVEVFAEIEPNQKERIIIALKKAGNVVGYMGDGINDASAIHAADVGISVHSAVDVAKEAADIVLLEKDLGVLVQGVLEGRATFANTLKYVFMATSANFGNMFSMAGVSLILPFLPLLPKQILLTNLMTDFPEMTIATDSVDQEMISRPRRWDIKVIRKFMITFGIVSSLFDYLTFGLLLLFLNATEIQFRTGWFVESVVSASLIVLIIRSRMPAFKSRPGKYLLITTLSIAIITLGLPYSPVAGILGFAPLPLSFILLIGLIVLLYIITAEIVKKIFYERVRF
ncbi:MAG: magnesium-translocating P-type ATPase [Ignavibacteria bacterium]|nr:magnesium-translocating P-type ATPase [Ignavibacteria bacterium]MCU7502065.1 magnesium-translocating P-type ATPase [Ignavibacteria bacterium]MCU7515467.1 magnesium-translocating P-type ATPase [Ignavibacteria bacterium]